METQYENSMKINTVSDLTDFIYKETDKMTIRLRAKHTSGKFVEFTERTLEKYVKLYDKPLFRKAKRELALQEAIETYKWKSFWWRIFHADLWQRIQDLGLNKSNTQEEKEEFEPEPAEAPQSLVPEIIKPISVPELLEDE